MLIRIRLEWVATDSECGCRPTELMKTVEMPAVPQVGTVLYLNVPDTDRDWFAEFPIVEEVLWIEEEGEMFEVGTTYVEVNCHEREFVGLMSNLGWAER